MTAVATMRTARPERDPHEWYVEEAWCPELLFGAEAFVGEIFDPCCGMGTIVKAARAAGHIAYGSDLVDVADRVPGESGSPWFEGTADFLRRDRGIELVDNIVMNPPFGRGLLARAFLDRARLCARRKVAALLPMPYLASVRRYSLWVRVERGEIPLARLHFHSNRPSMPPGGELVAGRIQAKGGKEDYFWAVFDAAHDGDPTAHWLIRKEGAR